MSTKTPNKYYQQRKNRRLSKEEVAHLEHKQEIKSYKKEMERLHMAKRGEQKQIKVEGIEYTLQHPGLLESIRMRDRAKNDAGQMGEEAIYRELLTHVIFLKEGGQPDFDFFEENPGFADVIREAMAFTFQ